MHYMNNFLHSWSIKHTQIIVEAILISTYSDADTRHSRTRISIFGEFVMDLYIENILKFC